MPEAVNTTEKFHRPQIFNIITIIPYNFTMLLLMSCHGYFPRKIGARAFEEIIFIFQF